MRKVVIVAQDSPIQGAAIERAFQRLGWRTTVIHYGLIAKWNLPLRVLIRKSPRLAGSFRAKSFNRVMRHLVLPIAACTDLLFFVKGEEVAPATRDALLRTRVPMVLWTLDSVSRFPGQMSLSPLVNHTFVVDGADAEDDDATWLPMGFDDEIYRPWSGGPEFDVLFAGNIYQPHYSGRRAALLEVIESALPGRSRCAYVGTSGNRVEDRRMQRLEQFRCFGRMAPRDYAALISRSRVVVNVHQDDGSRPINPNFFGIPAAGVCQLAEDRPYLGEWLRPGEDYAVFRGGELVPAIETLLGDDAARRRIAIQGHGSAHNNHTFVHRVETILSCLGLETAS